MTDEFLPQRREIQFRSLEGEAMVRDPESGRVHFLNPTAALVWAHCDGTATVSTCEAALREKFQVGPEVDLQADIHEAVRHFRALGLLVEAAPG